MEDPTGGLSPLLVFTTVTDPYPQRESRTTGSLPSHCFLSTHYARTFRQHIHSYASSYDAYQPVPLGQARHVAGQTWQATGDSIGTGYVLESAPYQKPFIQG